MKQSRQSIASPAQVRDRVADRVDLPRDLLTTVEAAERLRYVGPSAVKNFLKWADRWRVPRLKRGRVCLWQPSVLVAFLNREPWTRDRHAREDGPFFTTAHPSSASSTRLRGVK